MEAEMNPNLFWSLSAGEAEQMIAAINKNKLEVMKQEASIAWKLANLIAIGFNDPKNFPSMQKSFPGLYDTEKKPVKEKEKDASTVPEQTDWRVMQARMAYYAHAKNMFIKAGDNNDG